jgi:hypothetical protein
VPWATMRPPASPPSGSRSITQSAVGHYGFWRGFTDKAVGGYLDCGILDNGFARVRCGACRAEFLVAFSCKGRGLCPSCAAKRAAALAAFLEEEVLADVSHAQWVFSIPKMLRASRCGGSLRLHNHPPVADDPPSPPRSQGVNPCSLLPLPPPAPRPALPGCLGRPRAR